MEEQTLSALIHCITASSPSAASWASSQPITACSSPREKRREEVSRRLSELEKTQALQEQRLASGDRKFQEVIDSIKKLRDELRDDHKKLDEKVNDIQKTLARSIWQGVAEQR